MSVTLNEIVTHQDRLRREIMERECILAAFDVLHGYVASGRASQSAEVGSLVALLAPSAPLLMKAKSGEPTPPALPAPPKVEPYIHPELKQIGTRHGSNAMLVRWAVRRMTCDYSLRDIANVIRLQGRNLGTAAVSVVLNRMKSRGEIEEVTPGCGPNPAIFRKPEIAAQPDAHSVVSLEGDRAEGELAVTA